MKLSPLERIVLGISGALVLATALLLVFGGGKSAPVVVVSETARPGVAAAVDFSAETGKDTLPAQTETKAVEPAAPPPEEGAQAEDSSQGASPGPEITVDLNTATASQLEQLPGIGQKRAEAILAYRAENGPFVRIEQVMQVSGIGEGIFRKIQPYITVTERSER